MRHSCQYIAQDIDNVSVRMRSLCFGLTARVLFCSMTTLAAQIANAEADIVEARAEVAAAKAANNPLLHHYLGNLVELRRNENILLSQRKGELPGEHDLLRIRHLLL